MRTATIPAKTKKRKNCCSPIGFGDPENVCASNDPFAGESDPLSSLPSSPEGVLAIKWSNAASLQSCGFAGIGGSFGGTVEEWKKAKLEEEQDRKNKDIAAIAKKSIRRLIQQEGWVEHGEKEEKGHYREGMASKALCGCIPIPSQSQGGKKLTKRGLHEVTASWTTTGQSGMIEVGWSGPDELLRPVETRLEYLKNFSRTPKESGVISAGSRMTCKNPLVCPNCVSVRQQEAVGAIQLLVMDTLFSGNSYFFLTLALPHYYTDYRSIRLLSGVWRSVVSHRTYKELCKKYDVSFILRSFECTCDNLYYDYAANNAQMSGIHPHYHSLYKAPHDVTAEQIEGFRLELTDHVIDKLAAHVDADWLKKKTEFMRQHCVDVKLYGDYPDKILAETKQAWEAGVLAIPEDMQKFKAVIDQNWKDRPDHFVKQLAGIFGTAHYISAMTPKIQNSILAQEVARGTAKEGRLERRVSLQAFLYQASISDNPEHKQKALELIDALKGVKFCTYPRGWKKELEKEYRPGIYDHKAKKKVFAVTEKEWENEKMWRSENPVPVEIRGDRMTLDAFELGSEKWLKILAYGETKFYKELSSIIWHILEKEGKKSLTRLELVDIYHGFADHIFATVPEEKIKIPAKYFNSPCWDRLSWQLHRHESRSAVTRARLVRQADPAAFERLRVEIASDCLGFVLDLTEDDDGTTFDQREKFEHFDKLGVAAVIDRFWWREGRELVLADRRQRTAQAPIIQEIIEEDNRKFIREKFGDWRRRRCFLIYEEIIPICSSIARTLRSFVRDRFECDFYGEDCVLIGEFNGEKREVSAAELWAAFMAAVEERRKKKQAVQKKLDQHVQKCAVLAFVAAAARGEIWGVVDRLPLLEKPPVLEEAVA